MTAFSRFRLHAALALALAAATGPGLAQDVRIGFSPRTGDVWVDTWLGDVNRYGGTYRDAFVDELVRYHRAPRDLVLDLLGRPGWTPGDVYFACSLAAVVGRPCRFVVDEWERDREGGWGALAQRLGVKPGSPEFHRLKRGFVPTYDRWARPIQLDDDLARDFPGRGRGPGKGAERDARGDVPHGRDEHPGHGKGKGKPGKAKGEDARDTGPGKDGKGKGRG